MYVCCSITPNAMCISCGVQFFSFVVVQLIVVKLISIVCNNWNVCITC